jgi:NAD(P)H-flavin reductase
MNEMLTFPRRDARARWDLMVVGSRDLGEGLRRVSLIGGDELEGVAFYPGQVLVLSLPGKRDNRRYAIADFDQVELRLDLDVPIASDPAAACWLQTAQIGDPVRAERPRD